MQRNRGKCEGPAPAARIQTEEMNSVSDEAASQFS